MSDSEKPRPMDMDEVKRNLEAIARDPNHRDHFKALKMLSAEETASVVLPDPLSYDEVVERLIRVMKPCGRDACHTAYHSAFGTSHRDINLPPEFTAEDLTEEEMKIVANVTSIPVLYKTFPETKQNRVPKGYPVGKGMIAQRDWLRRAAIKILVDKRQKLREDAIKAKDAEKDKVREVADTEVRV